MNVRLITLILLAFFSLMADCSIDKPTTTNTDTAQLPWNGVRISENGPEQGRTFGIARRLKIAIPIIMFKLGVMTTVLGFLTLISIKILIIGIIMLVSHLSAFLAKLHVLKHDHGWGHSGHGGWSPQDVHVHLHHDQHSSAPIYHHHGHHGGWDKLDSSGSGGPYQNYQMERLNYLKNLYENYRNNLYQQEIR